tara:strand:- start:146 stop:1183 length:1038 start_codon:yes stop_codon:yes gene_type:complete
MVKIASKNVDLFLKSPDASVRAAIIYGPDGGLVRERSDSLARTIAGDQMDPFSVVELVAEVLNEMPGVLAEQAATVAFGGGRRLVRVRGPGEMGVAALAPILKHNIGDAFILVEAGNLSPRAPLRRLAEADEHAVALPCYFDSDSDLEKLILSCLGQAQLTIDQDALVYLLGNLGGDRQVTRREMEKLIIYVGSKSGNRVSFSDVLAIVGDGSDFAIEDVAYAVADGNQRSLDRSLRRSFDDGVSPVQVLRTVGWHFDRLQLVASACSSGLSVDQAIKTLRPPLFFKRAASFKSQLADWSISRMDFARETLIKAEIDCKTTGLPDNALCGRALMRLAYVAKLGPR